RQKRRDALHGHAWYPCPWRLRAEMALPAYSGAQPLPLRSAHAGWLAREETHMRWEGNRESDNVEDRRGAGGGMPVFGGRSIGIGTIVVALIGGWALGINPLTLLGMLSGGSPAQIQQAPAQRPPADDTLARFVS